MGVMLQGSRWLAIASLLTLAPSPPLQAQTDSIGPGVLFNPGNPTPGTVHRKAVQLESFENGQATLQVSSDYPQGFGIPEYTYFVPTGATEIKFKKKGRGICTLTPEREIYCRGEITSFQASYRQVITPEVEGRKFTIEVRSFNTFPIALEQTLSFPDSLILDRVKPAPQVRQGNLLRWQVDQLVDFRPQITFLDPRLSAR